MSRQIIRIAFRRDDPRLFARVVCLLRGGDSAHCEAAHAWDGALHECVSASWLDGGVRGKAIDMPAEKWRIYEVPAAIHPAEYLRVHDGDGYDVLGLLGILWPRLGHSARRRFCSEACAEMLGLPMPHLFDLRTLESVCAFIGRRVQ